MRRPAGRLIGQIRLHRRRRLRARGRGAADPDSGSAADARAQRIEVFSEDSRLLRTLLLTIALLSFVYGFQAAERVSAVQTLNDAHGNIAFEAVLGGKLTSPSSFQSLGVGDAMSEIDLLPRTPGPPELIVDAAAQAMLELERRGHRIAQQLGTVTLFSPTLNATVEASLDRVDRPRALQAAAAHAQDALVRARSGGSPPGDPSPPPEYLTQVAQRCPSKWLQAGARYRVAGDGEPVSREVAALSMGSATWRLSGFRRVNERGTRAPLINEIAEPADFVLYFFRMAEPAAGVGTLDCADYVLRWGYDYVGRSAPALLDAVADEGHLSAADRELIDDARRRLSKLSVRLTEGVDVGDQGVFILIPLAMVILSVWLSILLRRLTRDTGGQIPHLLMADRSDGPRRTVLDGPHFFYLERAVRTACLAYPILAPPVVVLSVPIVLAYPDIHLGLSMLLGAEERANSADGRALAAALLTTPVFYVAASLLVQAAHQLLLIFGRRPVRAQ